MLPWAKNLPLVDTKFRMYLSGEKNLRVLTHSCSNQR